MQQCTLCRNRMLNCTLWLNQMQRCTLYLNRMQQCTPLKSCDEVIHSSSIHVSEGGIAAITMHLPDAGSMPVQRLRRWTNIEPASASAMCTGIDLLS